MDDVARKLAAARARLILDKPFLGALVMRLPLIEADSTWCPTSATDARSLYYNHDYIDGLNLNQVQFVLAHEALHCGLSHFHRREFRDRKRWDVACDYAVNQLLVEDKLQQPVGALWEESYTGMTAEEIYPHIDSADDEEPMDQHLYDGLMPEESSELSQQSSGGSAAPPPLRESERDQLNTQWQQRLASAAQVAKQAGKLDGSIARMIDCLLRPSVPWRTLLAHYMSGTARIDYNLARPSQRREGDAILPSLHTHQIDIVIALDTSGSIKQPELDAFLAEINAIKSAIRARITLLACDAVLDESAPWVFEPWEAMHFPQQIKGGGSTDFAPVFEWVDAHQIRPDLLIYFTDARGQFPTSPPAYSTLWLVKGNADIPWGQRIQLN